MKRALILTWALAGCSPVQPPVRPAVELSTAFVGVVDARRQAFATRQALAQTRADARTAPMALFRALDGAELPPL